jgi:hypothetical protein
MLNKYAVGKVRVVPGSRAQRDMAAENEEFDYLYRLYETIEASLGKPKPSWEQFLKEKGVLSWKYG